jgi:hypothetical protein
MGVLEAVARIVQLGGAAERGPAVAALRAGFEARTGAFVPDDPWFEERSRAFWCDAVTTGRFGRQVEAELDEAERRWLTPIERAHRGLFRAEGVPHARAKRESGLERERVVLIDAWSGAELVVNHVDESSRAELDASAGQLFDARVVGALEPYAIAMLPGAVFHPRDATACIPPVLAAARAQKLGTGETLDALLRMNRALRSLSRVKAAYAYRVEALSPHAPAIPHPPVRRAAKAPT